MKKLLKTTIAFSMILAIICTSVVCCFAESTIPTVPVDFTPQTTTLQIRVTDYNGEEIIGHRIQLLDQDKNTIDEWETTHSYHRVVVPFPGTYYLRENSAPNYYNPNDLFKIDISNKPSNQPVIVNYKIMMLAPPIARYTYTIKDVLRIQRHLASYDQIPIYDYYYLDTDKNDRIDINDATLIQKHLAEMIELNEYFTC